MLWILDEEGNPVSVGMNFGAWSDWYEKDNRRELRKDVVGDAVVSTVFLGIAPCYGMSGNPVLWESMVLGGSLHLTCKRYSSAQDALEGHNALVLLVKTFGQKRS